MNCYYHPDQPAVAQCVKCMKGLCRECSDIYVINGIRYCPECYALISQPEDTVSTTKRDLQEDDTKISIAEDFHYCRMFLKTLRKTFLISTIAILIIGLVLTKLYSFGLESFSNIQIIFVWIFVAISMATSIVCVFTVIQLLLKRRKNTSTVRIFWFDTSNESMILMVALFVLKLMLFSLYCSLAPFYIIYVLFRYLYLKRQIRNSLS